MQKVIYVCTGPKNISLIAGLVIERPQSLPPSSQAPSPALPWLLHIQGLQADKDVKEQILQAQPWGKYF